MASIVAIPSGGGQVEAEGPLAKIRADIRRGWDAQRAFHPTWQSNLAFASGQQWLVWSDKSRTLRRIQDMDPVYKGKELYTADKIGETRDAILGEMGSDDDRPDLLLARDDRTSEDYQEQVNRAVGFGWDHEWLGDERVAEIDELTLDLGTAAMRCRFDADVGQVAYQNVPHLNGEPILNKDEQIQRVAAAADGTGAALSYKDIPAGRICWEPYSAFGIIPPAGVAREHKFPFDCLLAPTSLIELKRQFGDLVNDLREDGDIGSTLGEAVVGAPGEGAGRLKSRLRGFVWLFTYFERPTRDNPKGRVFYLAGKDMKLLKVEPQLPYVDTNGDYCAGIVYFHWRRVSGRFFSRSLVEMMKDGQRRKNKLVTQRNEIIDRGLPKVFRQRGTTSSAKTGEVLETVWTDPGEPAPIIYQGFGPGQHFYQEDEVVDRDLQAATGVNEPTLGQNPASVTNYSQLTALSQQSQSKRKKQYKERKAAIGKLVEFSVYDIKKYWGPEKQILIGGDEDRMDVATFNATEIPPFYIVSVAKGASAPRSEAGELQKVQDIWTAAVAVGAAMRDPDAWINWFKESLEAGMAVDLPDAGADDQVEYAQFENHLILQGYPVVPEYWHPPEIHIPQHRQAQSQADAAGDKATSERLEQHIQQHLLMQQANAARIQAGVAAGPQAPIPGLPPGNGIMNMQDANRMQQMQQPA